MGNRTDFIERSITALSKVVCHWNSLLRAKELGGKVPLGNSFNSKFVFARDRCLVTRLSGRFPIAIASLKRADFRPCDKLI
jgi:hypothetical protein